MSSTAEAAGHSIEARTIKKIQCGILPYLFFLYVICYIDRINVSIAALTMNKDLGITSEHYGLLVGIFFVGYFLFELPSNLLLHKIGARIWIARIPISWGAMTTLTGFVQSVHQLYVAALPARAGRSRIYAGSVSVFDLLELKNYASGTLLICLDGLMRILTGETFCRYRPNSRSNQYA